MIALGYFYDAPTPLTDVYDELLAIPFLSDGVATTTYSAFVKSVASVVETDGRRLVVRSAVVEHRLIWHT